MGMGLVARFFAFVTRSTLIKHFRNDHRQQEAKQKKGAIKFEGFSFGECWYSPRFNGRD